VTVKAYEDETALALALENPRVMQEAGESPEARALEIRQQILVMSKRNM
jgi:hypothetical protein